mmetsp:Transcript_7528/g.9832  ORF Transcript_7528/g.9832 Transcript_7528/m.9832 type:complete len:157 (+) Transcript_7528:167-637(+)
METESELDIKRKAFVSLNHVDEEQAFWNSYRGDGKACSKKSNNESKSDSGVEVIGAGVNINNESESDSTVDDSLSTCGSESQISDEDSQGSLDSPNWNTLNPQETPLSSVLPNEFVSQNLVDKAEKVWNPDADIPEQFRRSNVLPKRSRSQKSNNV